MSIDRRALVTRHNPRYSAPRWDAPLSVGNGRFCFTADFTGLQSFPGKCSPCPLCTMSEWGWHSYPDAPKDDRALRLKPYDTYGREVGYATSADGQEVLYGGLRVNAHRFDQGRIGLSVTGATPEDFVGTAQTLDMWTGTLRSEFRALGEPVSVVTLVHPEADEVCAHARSALIRQGRLTLDLRFFYPSHEISGRDESAPDGKHSTTVVGETSDSLSLLRTADGAFYRVDLRFTPGGRVVMTGPHSLSLSGDADDLWLVVRFSPMPVPYLPHAYDEAERACQSFWPDYWQKGGAVDFSGSTDQRSNELERRVVLSQYLTAIQSRGQHPPAETGLTCNSWFGKFHLEMHYWHCAHFPLWGRAAELESSLNYYPRILPVARDIAASQGYKGARWPKMCDPSGYNSPSNIAVLLAWQQPHPILLAEMCYRANPRPYFLRSYRDVVVESAEFMADYAHWDGSRYVLGAPLIPAQERHDPRAVLNPGFEVEYFRLGLRLANIWLSRLGEPENPLFTHVADRLARPEHIDGVYPAHENCPDTFSKEPFNTDHPSMLGMLGVLPGPDIERAVMEATLRRVLSHWDLAATWGWDFPLMAMTAARLGLPELAVDLLLMDLPKNTYLPNGHNKQGTRASLPLYLPGNGGLLLAIALMAAGWDGAHGASFPQGFTVRTEGIHPYL